MNLIPTWRTPITFTRDWEPLVTYGLVSLELVAPAHAAKGAQPEFGRLHELGGMLVAASRRLVQIKESSDSTSDPAVFERQEEVAESLEPLREFRELIAVAVMLVHAAAAGDKADFDDASPIEPLLRDGSSVVDLVNRYGPARKVEPLVSERGTIWGLASRDLVARASLEVFDLYAHRPPLRRCVLCGRVFIPRGNEINCRWHFWAWPNAIGDRPVELCNEAHRLVLEKAERDAHRREYVRLHTRLRRARQRHERTIEDSGPRSKAAQQTREALRAAEAEYVSLERRARGLKPNPVTEPSDLRPKEEHHG